MSSEKGVEADRRRLLDGFLLLLNGGEGGLEEEVEAERRPLLNGSLLFLSRDKWVASSSGELLDGFFVF